MEDFEYLNRIFLFNIFDYMAPVYSYFLSCLGAIFAGVVVGKEREKAQKAAGLRTFAMVALGACVFTLAPRLMLEEGIHIDLSRIPAQIVSGVGFLGAGAVFRSGRVVSGLTTAAGIWATAAVGLIFGLGFLIFGLSITFMIYILLWVHGLFDRRNMILREWCDYYIHINSHDGKGPILVDEIMCEWGHNGSIVTEASSQDIQIVKFRLSPNHRPHQRFLSELAVQPYVVKLCKGKLCE